MHVVFGQYLSALSSLHITIHFDLFLHPYCWNLLLMFGQQATCFGLLEHEEED